MVKSENIFFVQKIPQMCLKSKSFNCIFPTAEETHPICISWNLIHIQQARTCFTDVRATPSPPHLWLELTGVTQSKKSKDMYVLILVQIYNISCNRHYSKLPRWRTIPKNIFFLLFHSYVKGFLVKLKMVYKVMLCSAGTSIDIYISNTALLIFLLSLLISSVLANVGLSAQIVIHKIT